MANKISPVKAIQAKCHNCTGFYADGKNDCGNTQCELYSYMPYRKQTPNLEWAKYNAKKVGMVIKTKKVLTDEERALIRSRFTKGVNPEELETEEDEEEDEDDL